MGVQEVKTIADFLIADFEGEMRTTLSVLVRLIRSRGHLSKGGYDGTHGIRQEGPARSAAVL